MSSLTSDAWSIKKVSKGISVAISSLTAHAHDTDLAKRVKEINKIIVKTFCPQNVWGFTEHNNITADQQLNRSRLNLKRTGISLLSQNFISYINGQ